MSQKSAMCKAMLLDIDGVIIGEKQGENSPYPHPEVAAKLREVRESGIPVVLCSARAVFIMSDIIKDFENPHIAANGAIILDSKGVGIKKYLLDKETARAIIKVAMQNNLYTEVNTANGFYVQKNQKNEITEKTSVVMKRLPETLLDSLEEACEIDEIVGVMPIVPSVKEKASADEILKPLESLCDITWTTQPSLPYQFAVITAKGVSKRRGALDVQEILGIPLENMLGVGDSKGDWQFMEFCGKAAAMGNAGEDLKELVRTKGANGYIGKSVDENGIIDIIDWYLES